MFSFGEREHGVTGLAALSKHRAVLGDPVNRGSPEEDHPRLDLGKSRAQISGARESEPREHPVAEGHTRRQAAENNPS